MASNFEAYFSGRRVLVTGHTGFKGSWLVAWLSELGADVHGLALPPVDEQGLFVQALLTERLASHSLVDVRDASKVAAVFRRVHPEVVFHLAAQPLVIASYEDPPSTFATNVMGLVNVLEAVRVTKCVRVCQVVTSDKCYARTDKGIPHKESDRLGGVDPYSSSKACADLIAASYRSAFLNEAGVGLSTVRAGNVIGGGDWAADRIVPDFFCAARRNSVLKVRSPAAVRPWQHVLEPLAGYLRLAAAQAASPGVYDEAWNFGPEPHNHRTVAELVCQLSHGFRQGAWVDDLRRAERTQQQETRVLRLDCTKAKRQLGWHPALSFEDSVGLTVDWYARVAGGEPAGAVTLDQLHLYRARLTDVVVDQTARRGAQCL